MEDTFIKRIGHSSLTKAQLKIADYIAKNQKRILGMTAQEIGKEVGVSDASVIRFSRIIGYEGFADLKEQIQKELRSGNEKIGKHSLHDRFVMQLEKYTKGSDTENQILQLMQINLETSVRQNSEGSYERIAERILNAERKVTVGLRGGKGCAVQFSRLLGLITDNVRSITDEGHDQLVKLTELGEKDIVIYLNFPRYYKIDEEIGRILSLRKVPCVLVTDSMASPLVKYAEEILLVETEHCGFFHSMLGVEGVLEYLLILMCWRQPEVFRQRLAERDAVLESYRLE